jgi:hypothetical protein
LIAGGAIGWGFGRVQAAARQRHEEKQREGSFHNGWSLMPGSGARVALLLLALVLVQVICPLFFRDSVKWWLSGGVTLGYGWHLARQLMQLRRGLRH